MNYLVLIGDIQASRKARQRHALQSQLQAVLSELNHHDNPPLSPYTITLGDEFQAVFNQADTLFADLLQILIALHPVRVRFSIGQGGIATELNPDQALGMDGPAFYLAREGIDQLKDSGDLFRINGLPDDNANLVNGSLKLFSQRILKWQVNRLSILHSLIRGEKVQPIAERLGISEQAVYKNINKGGLDAVIQVLSAISTLLNKQLQPH